jgi:hypothetical protein
MNLFIDIEDILYHNDLQVEAERIRAELKQEDDALQITENAVLCEQHEFLTIYDTIIDALKETELFHEDTLVKKIQYAHPSHEYNVVFDPQSRTFSQDKYLSFHTPLSLTTVGFVGLPYTSLTRHRLPHDLTHELLHIDAIKSVPNLAKAYAKHMNFDPLAKNPIKDWGEGLVIASTLIGLRALPQYTAARREAIGVVDTALAAVSGETPRLVDHNGIVELPYYNTRVGLGALITLLYGRNNEVLDGFANVR